MLSTLHWCLAGETKLKNLHKLGMPAGGWPYPCCCNAIRFNSTNIYWVSRCAEHCAKGWGAGKAAQPTTTALEDVPTTIDVQPRETAWASVQTVFTSLSAFTIVMSLVTPLCQWKDSFEEKQNTVIHWVVFPFWRFHCQHEIVLVHASYFSQDAAQQRTVLLLVEGHIISCFHDTHVWSNVGPP